MSLNSRREEKLNSLLLHHIYAQSFIGFNDPYDGRLCCEYEKYENQLQSEQNRVLQRRSAYCVSVSENLDFVEDAIEMWTHYAADHTGFCIVFNHLLTNGLKEINTTSLRENMDTINIYGKILYEESLPCYYPNSNVENLSILEAMFTKSSRWSQENEVRLIFNKSGYHRIEEKAFSHIYCGINISYWDYLCLKELANHLGCQIHLLKPSQKEYKLEEYKGSTKKYFEEQKLKFMIENKLIK